MSHTEVAELLNAYCRLVRDEVADWTPWIVRFAAVIERLQRPPAGDLTAQVGELPFAPLLIALGHHVDGQDAKAVAVLREAHAALLSDKELNSVETAKITAASVAGLRAQARAGVLAVFLAACGAHEEALWLFAQLEGARRMRSLWETALLARTLFAAGHFAGALNVALEGVEELLQRRRRLDDTALRLNFGGEVGFSLTQIAAAAALAHTDDERGWRLGLSLGDLGRDPLLAEILHTITRAPVSVLLRLPAIRRCWAAEAEAFQWSDLFSRMLVEAEPGLKLRAAEEKLSAAEAARREAKTRLRQAAPDLYSFFYRPGAALLRSPVRPDVDVVADVQRELEPGAAILGYELFENDVFGWALTHDRLWVQRLGLSASELADHVAAVRTSCRFGALAGEARLASLSEALLGWADDILDANGLDANGRLLLVPSGPLRALPFAALLWRGRALVATHACSVLPTLGVFPDLIGRKSINFQNAAIAAFGNPSDARWTSPTGETVTVSSLRHAEREAQEIVTLAGDRAHLLRCGSQVTRDAVLDALRTADIVHLATHARFCPEAPLFSAFLLSDGEQLTVIDLIAVESRCRLIVASACSTGEGARTSGDDVLGVSRGLLACGASAAVVSLWPVDDAHTADLMIAFYQGLFSGLEPAQALRQAQLSFLDREAGVPTHSREAPAELFPVGGAGAERYWSPFIVIGA
ncbi:MAG: CHAT domain-containing protein [Caldilinea sp.]|uniref:CHAT domain-containing protein n=1 Tax=Caldilinea sp. TaxID=2293560 RepID=UPI0030B4E053